MTSGVLSVDSLSCRIGDAELLRDISFSVPDSSFVSIIGPNGAGKSTLLRCIMRIINYTSGTITLFGKNLNEYTQKQLAGSVAYVPQTAQDTHPFTVEEFVAMSRYPYHSLFHTGQADHDAIVETALLDAGVSQLRSHLMSTLSGGERQKVMLAGCLAQDPKIYLLDEVTAYLDPKCQIEVSDILDRLKQRREISIISVTHDINFALRFSDMIFALVDGRHAFYGSPDALDASILNNIFQTDFIYIDDPRTGRPLALPKGF